LALAPETAGKTLDEATYARVGYTLLYGLLISIAVMIIGLIVGAVTGKTAAAHVLSLDRVLPQLAKGSASAVLDLGILLLFATPLAGVLVALAEFVRIKDRAFAGITLAVGILLCVGFVVALH
jgi:uncharacterized membrane protein